MKKKATLFSFLGTNDYDDIIYELPSGKVLKTKFAQLAIYEEIKNHYDHINIHVFLTSSARQKNWESDGASSLQATLSELPQDNITIQTIDIPEKQDDNAIWKLFDILLKYMQQDEIVYFDMTYGFRSIPFVSFIVLQYAKNLKNITFGGLYYGMIHTPQYGHGIINDFTSMMKLVNWADGVNQYVRTGNASVINELVSTESQLQSSNDSLNEQDQKQVARLNNVAYHMNKVSESFETVRGETIFAEIDNLYASIKELDSEQSTYLKALLPILDKVKEKIKPFDSTKADQIKFIINWCIEHGLYQQAYTFLLEFIINGFCDYLQLNKYQFSNRSFVQTVINIIHYNTPKHEWRVQNKFKRQLGHIIRVKQLDHFKPYFYAYLELNKHRNDINHAGINTFKRQFPHFRKNIEKYKLALFPLFDELYKENS